MHKRTLLTLSLFLLATASGSAQKSFEPTFGISMSKSILGLSYRDGMNEYNLGFRGLGYSSRDGFIAQPGISYNRYLTANGFYVSAIYVPTYRSRSSEGFVFNAATDTVEYRVSEKKGWESSFFMAGLGKSFQFTRWGLHVDGGAVTAANSEFGQVWGYYLGGAVSYRFKLGGRAP